MTNPRISLALESFFGETPVVFWHDVEAEFAAVVDSLQLDGVQLVRLDETPALRIKLDIEKAPDRRWLIYSTQPEPEPTKDWLAGCAPAQQVFRADSTSILLEDLGLTTQSVAPAPEGARQVSASQGPGGPPEAPGAAWRRRAGPGPQDAGGADCAVRPARLFAMLQRLYARPWWWTAASIWRPSPKPGRTCRQ
jgi:hypothetical protein